MDEPTSGLDARAAAIVMRCVQTAAGPAFAGSILRAAGAASFAARAGAARRPGNLWHSTNPMHGAATSSRPASPWPIAYHMLCSSVKNVSRTNRTVVVTIHQVRPQPLPRADQSCCQVARPHTEAANAPACSFASSNTPPSALTPVSLRRLAFPFLPPQLPVQPSMDIFEAFDWLILLQRGGRLTYHGPLGFESRCGRRQGLERPQVCRVQPRAAHGCPACTVRLGFVRLIGSIMIHS